MSSVKITALFTMALLTAASAALACTNPTGTEGQIVYNGTFKIPQYCNGTQWVAWGSGFGVSTDRITSGTTGVVTSNAGGGSITFTTGGSQRMVVDSLGRVGIGTTSPSAELNIKGGVAGILLEETTGGPNNEAYLVHFSNQLQIQNRDTNFNYISTPYLFDIRAPLNTIYTLQNGNVGIGTASPATTLDVSGTIQWGSGAYLQMASGNPIINFDAFDYFEFARPGNFLNLHIGGGVRWSVTASGDMTIGGAAFKPGGGTWAATSDARLKDVNGDYTRGLAEIGKLKPVQYRYKKDNPRKEPSDKAYVGLVAQEVLPVFPEAVSKAKDGYYSLDSTPITFAMINAIKELKAENDRLRAEFEAYKAVRP